MGARRISKSTDPGIDHGHQKDHYRALDAVARPLSGLGPMLADVLANDEFGPPRELSCEAGGLRTHLGPLGARLRPYLGRPGPNARKDRANWRDGSPAGERHAGRCRWLQSAAQGCTRKLGKVGFSSRQLFFTLRRSWGPTRRYQAGTGEPGAAPRLPRRRCEQRPYRMWSGKG